jgi:hypothetical protein
MTRAVFKEFKEGHVEISKLVKNQKIEKVKTLLDWKFYADSESVIFFT